MTRGDGFVCCDGLDGVALVVEDVVVGGGGGEVSFGVGEGISGSALLPPPALVDGCLEDDVWLRVRIGIWSGRTGEGVDEERSDWALIERCGDDVKPRRSGGRVSGDGMDG